MSHLFLGKYTAFTGWSLSKKKKTQKPLHLFNEWKCSMWFKNYKIHPEFIFGRSHPKCLDSAAVRTQHSRWVLSDDLILWTWIYMNSDIDILSLNQSLPFTPPGYASIPSAGCLGGQWLVLLAGKVSSQIGKFPLEPELPPPVEWSLAVWAPYCSAANCVAHESLHFFTAFLCQ